jgi:rhodanese-related sulfurtransferase
MKPLLSPFALFLLLIVTAFAGVAEEAASDKQSFEPYKNIVDADFVAQHAVIPKKKDVLIIDSRPSRKYDKGHIVPSINISNSQFDKHTDKLPEDKSNALIFYCGGLKCPLSHKSARKAEALGYTNIQVYAAGYPDWESKGHTTGVSAAYMKKLVDKGADSVIVDARPARKFKKGHVPGAINISARELEDKWDMLPADKAAEVIFYCGGYKCPLSTKSAAKAVAQGYTNVRLFQAGYPAWKEAYGEEVADAGAGAAGAAAIQKGEDEGTITVDSFNKLMTESPDSVYWYDVRDEEEVEADGTYGGAVVLSVDDVEDQMESLPSDKPIVFFCSTGARSGEAYDLVRMKRNDLSLYFLDAEVTFHEDGSPPTAAATN